MSSRKNLSVAQSRKGRRPMSVQTMLRKEKEGTLYKNTKLGADLEAARDTTVHALEALKEKNRYSKALEDVKEMSSVVGQKLGLPGHKPTSMEDRWKRLLARRGEVEKTAEPPPPKGVSVKEWDKILQAKTAGKYGKNGAGYDLQGKTEVQGLPVAIENRVGSVREGENDDGSKWKTKFRTPYGYIEGTKGADGDEVDAYVGPDKSAPKAYIVHQKKSDGSHDEDTVMLGFKSKGDAKKDILKHYDDKSQIGGVDEMPVEMLRAHLARADGKKIEKLAAEKADPETKVMQAGALGTAGVGLTGLGNTHGEVLGYKRIYHGTTKDNAKKIRKSGLDPKFGGTGAGKAVGSKGFMEHSRGKVHVTPSKQVANAYSRLLGSKGVDRDAKMLDMVDIMSGKGGGDVVEGAIPFEAFKKNFRVDPDQGIGAYRTTKKVSPRLLRREGESALSVGRRAIPRDVRGYMSRNKGRVARGIARPLVAAASLAGSAKLLYDAHQEYKTASLGTGQASLNFRDGDPPHMTGLPARLRRHKGDVPSRMLQDPYPAHTVEDRNESQETKVVETGSAAGGEDVGKYASPRVVRALANQRGRWKGPTRDVGGNLRSTAGSAAASQDEPKTASRVSALRGVGRRLSKKPVKDEVYEKTASALEATIREAFLDELRKIAEAGGAPGDIDKLASSSLVEGLIKEAVFKQMAGGLKRLAVGGTTPQGIPVKGMLSGLKGSGARMKAVGQNMKTSPAQRIQAAGAAPQEAQQLAQQAQRFGVKAPGAGKRIAGEAVEGAGAHVQHASPIKMTLNPLGTVIGGGIEGGTKGVGKELVRSTGLAGQVGAGGFRGSLGRGLQKAAPAAGMIGEVGTLGAIGGLAHLPLSHTGVIGTGIAKASPLIGKGLATLGQVGGHVGADALGTAVHHTARAVPRFFRRAGEIAGDVAEAVG